MNSENLYRYILNCDSKLKRNLLENINIKRKIILDDNDYPFIWLIQSLNKEELEQFLDEAGIDILIESKKISHKLNAIITLENNINYEVLSNQKIIKKIIEYKNELDDYLTNVNIKFIENLFYYVVNNNCDFDIIFKCSKNLYKLFENQKIIDIINQKKLINATNLNKLEKNALEILIKNDYYQNIILNDFDNDKFNQIILNETMFPDELLINSKFINKLINNKSVSEYRLLINSLQKNNNINLIQEIELINDKKYDSIIFSYDNNLEIFGKYKKILNKIFIDNKIVDQVNYFEIEKKDIIDLTTQYDIDMIYFNKNLSDREKYVKLVETFKNLTNKEFKEILIGRFFKDVPYNFLLNLNTLIEFNEKNGIINDDNLKRYIEIQKNDCFDKKLYDSFEKNENYVTQFYDDFQKSKEYAYQMLKESIVDIYKIESQKNKSLSQIYNVPIYEFNGEPFYLLIHNTSKQIDTDEYHLQELFHENKKNDGISLSLISNEKMNYYNDYKKSIIFGFKKFEIKQIVHLYNSDSYSFYKYGDNRVSNRITKLYLPTDLIKDTCGYNEIVYQEKTKNTQFLNIKELTPDYLVCFDYVSDSEAKIAKYYNIPIIKINKEKYNIDQNNIKNKSINALIKDGDSESYIDSYFKLKNKLR